MGNCALHREDQIHQHGVSVVTQLLRLMVKFP